MDVRTLHGNFLRNCFLVVYAYCTLCAGSFRRVNSWRLTCWPRGTFFLRSTVGIPAGSWNGHRLQANFVGYSRGGGGFPGFTPGLFWTIP